MIKIAPLQGWKDFTKWVDEYPKRAEKGMEAFVHDQAEFFQKQVVEKLPKGPDFVRYRKLVKTARIPSTKGESVFATYLDDNDPKAGKKVKPQYSLIYVQEQPNAPYNIRGRRIKALVEFQPWTEETLPFWPEQRYAVAWRGRVSRLQQLLAVRRLKRDKIRIRLRLRQAGVKWNFASRDPEGVAASAKPRSPILDLAESTEFGDGPGARPVWRMAVGKTKRFANDLINKPKIFQPAFSSLQFNKWTGWAKRIRGKVSPGRAKSWELFAKKIAPSK